MDTNSYKLYQTYNPETAQKQKVDYIGKENYKYYLITAVISYIFSYIYVKWLIEYNVMNDAFPYGQNLLFVFSILFIVATEILTTGTGLSYNKLISTGRRQVAIESVIVMLCYIFQSFAVWAWDYHGSDWGFYQIILWHLTAIYYVLCRTGSLIAGRSGIYILIDLFHGIFSIPWPNFIQRLTVISSGFRYAATDYRNKRNNKISSKTIIVVITSVIIAAFICGYTVSQLSQISNTFNNLLDLSFIRSYFDNVFDIIFDDFYLIDTIFRIIISIPIGAWLFGLISGQIIKRYNILSLDEFNKSFAKMHIFPKISAYIIIVSVCFVYTVFMISAVVDAFSHNSFITATAVEASSIAVGSFWQLIRVVVMNFAILFASCFLAKEPLWDNKSTRILTTVMFVYSTIFALLAAWNLFAVYIGLYGFTPRRILAALVIVNVLVWCSLVFIRLYHRIPAAQIGILFGAISYSIVVCFKF